MRKRDDIKYDWTHYNWNSLRIMMHKDLSSKLAYIGYVHMKALNTNDEVKRIEKLLSCTDLIGDIYRDLNENSPLHKETEMLFYEILDSYYVSYRGEDYLYYKETKNSSDRAKLRIELDEFRNELKDKLSNSSIEEVFNLIESKFKLIGKTVPDEIHLLKSRMYYLDKEKYKGTISLEEYRTVQNRIIESTIRLIDELK